MPIYPLSSILGEILTEFPPTAACLRGLHAPRRIEEFLVSPYATHALEVRNGSAEVRDVGKEADEHSGEAESLRAEPQTIKHRRDGLIIARNQTPERMGRPIAPEENPATKSDENPCSRIG